MIVTKGTNMIFITGARKLTSKKEFIIMGKAAKNERSEILKTFPMYEPSPLAKEIIKKVMTKERRKLKLYIRYGLYIKNAHAKKISSLGFLISRYFVLFINTIIYG